MTISRFTLWLVGPWTAGQTSVRRVISRDVSRTVASWRRTFELLGMRLDLRAVSSWAPGKAAKGKKTLFYFDTLRKRHEDRALRVLRRHKKLSEIYKISNKKFVTTMLLSDKIAQRGNLHGFCHTNVHLRNVQPSLQQHIACNLRDVATMS